jgi:hypothetical protein
MISHRAFGLPLSLRADRNDLLELFQHHHPFYRLMIYWYTPVRRRAKGAV